MQSTKLFSWPRCFGKKGDKKRESKRTIDSKKTRQEDEKKANSIRKLISMMSFRTIQRVIITLRHVQLWLVSMAMNWSRDARTHAQTVVVAKKVVGRRSWRTTAGRFSSCLLSASRRQLCIGFFKVPGRRTQSLSMWHGALCPPLPVFSASTSSSRGARMVRSASFS